MGSNDNMYLSEVSEGAKVGKQIWLQLHKKKPAPATLFVTNIN